MMMRPSAIINHIIKQVITSGLIIRYIVKVIFVQNAISSLSDFLLSGTGIKGIMPIESNSDLNDHI